MGDGVQNVSLPSVDNTHRSNGIMQKSIYYRYGNLSKRAAQKAKHQAHPSLVSPEMPKVEQT